MSKRALFALLLGSALGLDAACAHAPAPEMRFDDADAWATHFENPHRDTWQLPDEVVRALEITPTMKLADLGAATGYFSVRLARAAKEGRVWAIDIEPMMVRYVIRRARLQGLDNLFGILATPDDPMLPEAVDLVLIVDTYHHIQNRPAYFERLRGQLRPGGRLAVVDFRLGELPVGPPASMRLAPEVVQEELEAAGYVLDKSYDLLPYQYFLVFGATPMEAAP